MVNVAATTKRILDVQLAHRAKIRNAYVELQGIPCKWYRATEGTERRDFYGDIKSATLVREVGTISIVMRLSEQNLKLLSTFDGNISDDYRQTIEGSVKVTDLIQEGDRVSFEFRYFNSASEDIKYLEVTRVEGANNQNPIHKLVWLAPVHDLNVIDR